MKKIMQITLIACAVLLAVLVLPVAAFADGGVSIMGGDPGMNGEQYFYTNYVKITSVGFEQIVNNNTSSPITVTYTVSRTKYFDDSASGTDASVSLENQCPKNAEISCGQTQTVTRSYSWTIPANSEAMCQYGSSGVRAFGYGEHWFYGTLKYTYNISTRYTYQAYSSLYIYD